MEVFRLPAEAKASPNVFRLWFDPSGEKLLILSGSFWPDRLYEWGVVVRKLLSRRSAITDVNHRNCWPYPAFDRTLRYMAMLSYVEDRVTRKRIAVYHADPAQVLSEDGLTLYIYNGYSLATRFDLDWNFEGKKIEARPDEARSVEKCDDQYVDCLSLSPAGDLLAVRIDKRKQLLPFRTVDASPLDPIALPVFKTDGERMTCQHYGRLQFAADNRTVASAGDGVCLADALGEREVKVLDKRHFADVAFTPDGKRLVGVRPDGVAVVWDVASGEALASYDFHPVAGRLKAVAVAPDGLTAVAGGSKGRLVRWDL